MPQRKSSYRFIFAFAVLLATCRTQNVTIATYPGGSSCNEPDDFITVTSGSCQPGLGLTLFRVTYAGERLLNYEFECAANCVSCKAAGTMSTDSCMQVSSIGGEILISAWLTTPGSTFSVQLYGDEKCTQASSDSPPATQIFESDACSVISGAMRNLKILDFVASAPGKIGLALCPESDSDCTSCTMQHTGTLDCFPMRDGGFASVKALSSGSVALPGACSCTCCAGFRCLPSHFVGNAGLDCNACNDSCRNRFVTCPSERRSGRVTASCSVAEAPKQIPCPQGCTTCDSAGICTACSERLTLDSKSNRCVVSRTCQICRDGIQSAAQALSTSEGDCWKFVSDAQVALSDLCFSSADAMPFCNFGASANLLGACISLRGMLAQISTRQSELPVDAVAQERQALVDWVCGGKMEDLTTC